MDYKGLVEQLKSAAPLHGTWLRERMLDAADAIETMLAERDAAVEELRGECRYCAHNTGWHNAGRCAACFHETVTIPLPGFNNVDNWEWRGPQKGESNDQKKL